MTDCAWPRQHHRIAEVKIEGDRVVLYGMDAMALGAFSLATPRSTVLLRDLLLVFCVKELAIVEVTNPRAPELIEVRPYPMA